MKHFVRAIKKTRQEQQWPLAYMPQPYNQRRWGSPRIIALCVPRRKPSSRVACCAIKNVGCSHRKMHSTAARAHFPPKNNLNLITLLVVCVCIALCICLLVWPSCFIPTSRKRAFCGVGTLCVPRNSERTCIRNKWQSFNVSRFKYRAARGLCDCWSAIKETGDNALFRGCP